LKRYFKQNSSRSAIW